MPRLARVLSSWSKTLEKQGIWVEDHSCAMKKKSSPSEAPSASRQRVWHQKNRAGCSTCKKRHVKCDERKPNCLKCEKANLECGGYEVFRVWFAEQPKRNKSTGPSRGPSPSIGAEETRSLQFFHEKTKPSLALFNSAAPVDEEATSRVERIAEMHPNRSKARSNENSFSLWTVIIPRLATMEDTVRYHLVATALAHELSMSRKKDPRTAKLLMQAHSKAIRLVAYDKSPRTDIILISCLLSIAMESVQGHYATAYKHLQSGLAILESWRVTDHTDHDDPNGLINQYLEPIFTQLAVTFGLLFNDTTDPHAISTITWTPPPIPAQFTSIHEARESLAALAAYVNILSRKGQPFQDHCVPTIESLKAAWHTWTTSFHALRPTLTTPRSLQQWTLLSVFATVHKIAFHCYCAPTEQSWDAFLPALETQVAMCAELDAQIATYTPDDAILMDPGIIVPLWQIAIGCRDPGLRRRAVRLMHAHHRKCSGANSSGKSDCFIALHAQAVIDLEEYPDLGHLPPEVQRIRPLTASVATPGYLSMSFTRGATNYREVEHHMVPFPAGVSVPEGRSVQMWPMSKVVRLAGYQLLIRPEPRGCRCGGFGGGAVEGEEGEGMVAL